MRQDGLAKDTLGLTVRTILKLTCWVYGPKSSILDQKRVRVPQTGELKQTETELKVWGECLLLQLARDVGGHNGGVWHI